MNKIISFLKELTEQRALSSLLEWPSRVGRWLGQSNRYKHLVGGFIVGLCALGVWAAVYAAIVAASCLELKDKLRGSVWDWIDWGLTVIGGGIAAIIWLIL